MRKNEKQFVSLRCASCDATVLREKKQHTYRTKKLGAEPKVFCGLSCSAAFNNAFKTGPRPHLRGRPSPMAGKRAPNYKGDFSKYLRLSRRRGWECDLDDAYLAGLWKSQGGHCAYSGAQLELSTFRSKLLPLSASIDRIDSRKGYVRGNVHFIAYCLNLAKSVFEEKDFLAALAQIAVGITNDRKPERPALASDGGSNPPISTIYGDDLGSMP